MSRLSQPFPKGACALMCVAALSACSSAPGEDPAEGRGERASSELLGAPLDPNHHFDVGICAGGLVPAGQPNAGTCDSYECSGTLVAPNLVLTARHCIRQIDYADAFCDSTFSTAALSDAPTVVTTSPSTITGTPKWYGVKAELLPSGNHLCGDDLALLVLNTSVPRSEAVPVPVDFVRDVAKSKPRSVAVVGRGAVADVLDPSTFDETTDDQGLQRRVLENISFDCATDNATCDVVDYSSPPTNEFSSPPSYFVIGSAVAPGDSGSGVFDQATFRFAPVVLGVTAASTYGADGVPNHGLITRLDQHRAFIVSGFVQALLSR